MPTFRTIVKATTIVWRHLRANRSRFPVHVQPHLSTLKNRRNVSKKKILPTRITNVQRNVSFPFFDQSSRDTVIKWDFLLILFRLLTAGIPRQLLLIRCVVSTRIVRQNADTNVPKIRYSIATWNGVYRSNKFNVGGKIGSIFRWK